MTNSKELLAQELSVLYPDVTDTELNEMTDRLIDFFVVCVKAVYETEKAVVSDNYPITDINDN